MVLLANVIVFSFGETEHVVIQAKPAAARMVPGALVDVRWILVPTSEAIVALPRRNAVISTQ
ncbi:hypothetical protein MES4922_210019 [Mesorhizobium ventifaucium]|uniref:Transport-associated OB type 2 domain-containing protein n=1 Tax=Mesorhizobium ventifaucium TaxID=666020 RepID=A0ABN8JQR1_9HYPH|nr:hypothetical protein MES4922_210019 [Mesorhizobium ventifaucium]